MRYLLVPFLVLAGLGFVLSLVAHVCSIFGVGSPLGSWTMGLHIGIFAVWFPAMIVMARRKEKPKDWKDHFRGCPRWMGRVTTLAFVYAIVNVGLFLLFNADKLPVKGAGPAPPDVVRVFSGHWMIFYATAFTALYSAMAAARADEELARKAASKAGWREFEDWS